MKPIVCLINPLYTEFIFNKKILIDYVHIWYIICLLWNNLFLKIWVNLLENKQTHSLVNTVSDWPESIMKFYGRVPTQNICSLKLRITKKNIEFNTFCAHTILRYNGLNAMTHLIKPINHLIEDNWQLIKLNKLLIKLREYLIIIC